MPRSLDRCVVVVAIVLALAASGCGGLSGIGLPLGYSGELWPGCDAQAAEGAVALAGDGRVQAATPGTGVIVCRNGDRVDVDVRRPATIEIVVYGQPRANEAHFIYTHVLDAAGHVLAGDDRFQWSATNADIRDGTCTSGADRSTGCVADSTAATLVARSPSTTIHVTYAGVSASRTIPVLPASP